MVAPADKVKIGVCVMEKKVKCHSEVFSAPMGQIFDRLQAFGEFEVIHFGDKVILEEPIESRLFYYNASNLGNRNVTVAQTEIGNASKLKLGGDILLLRAWNPVYDANVALFCSLKFSAKFVRGLVHNQPVSSKAMERCGVLDSSYYICGLVLPRPFVVNELEPQHLLHDRRKVYEHEAKPRK
ncbi:hypothetical protein V8G54_013229 [Vigna mungo]|uniref:VIP1 N-terminal domain-containing protein n=1 Tax=Vigna mungo TaxID=3915 RepID=A0AAQ3S442_VIGMU